MRQTEVGRLANTRMHGWPETSLMAGGVYSPHVSELIPVGRNQERRLWERFSGGFLHFYPLLLLRLSHFLGNKKDGESLLIP